MTLATPSPPRRVATAAVRRWCETSEAATTEPMPKKAPCGMPARKRAPMTVG